MNILFLDFDGVLNRDRTWRAMNKDPDLQHDPINHLDAELCSRVQEACDGAGIDAIVLSTSWRKRFALDEIKAWLAAKGLTIPIIGRTPFIHARPEFCQKMSDYDPMWSQIGRGMEIQWWLRRYRPDDAWREDHIVILDDERTMGSLNPWLIRCHPKYGFLPSQYAQFAKTLEKPLTKLEWVHDALRCHALEHRPPLGPITIEINPVMNATGRTSSD